MSTNMDNPAVVKLLEKVSQHGLQFEPGSEERGLADAANQLLRPEPVILLPSWGLKYKTATPDDYACEAVRMDRQRIHKAMKEWFASGVSKELPATALQRILGPLE